MIWARNPTTINRRMLASIGVYPFQRVLGVVSTYYNPQGGRLDAMI
jgi:hypothetical protein